MVNARDQHPEPLIVPLSTDGSETLTFDVGGTSGWAAYHSALTAQHQAHVLVRVGPETFAADAPLVIAELRVSTVSKDAEFNSPLLRSIPFGRITAAINRPTVIAELRGLVAPPNQVWAGSFPGSEAWTYVLPPHRKSSLRQPRLVVKDPGTRRKADDFYKRVAELYLNQASISERAAKDIAEANELPYTTVHRWLKEARNRGLLRLPGQRGGDDDGRR